MYFFLQKQVVQVYLAKDFSEKSESKNQKIEPESSEINQKFIEVQNILKSQSKIPILGQTLDSIFNK